MRTPATDPGSARGSGGEQRSGGERCDAAPGPSNRRGGARALLRFLLLAGTFGLLGQLFAAPLTQLLLPLFRAEFELLDDAFRIESLSVDRDQVDRVLRVQVSLARTLSVNGRTFYRDPRGRAQATTLLGNIWMPCVLLIAVTFAWPAPPSRGRMAVRLLATPVALLLMCMASAPLILLASLRGILLQATGSASPSMLLIWSDFLLNGGIIVLPLVAGAALGHLTGAPERP